MDRRAFLKTSLLSAATISLANGFPGTQPSGKPRKVIIAGAGLAGLTAGYELVQAGYDVTVLEGSMRAGGRVHTLRDVFADGLSAEAGAIDFGDGYANLLHYIHLFNIPLQELSFGKEVLWIRGKRLVLGGSSAPEWPLTLTIEERRLGRDGLYKKYLGPAVGQVGNPLRSNWLEQTAKYDVMTVQEYLRQAGLSDDAVQLVSMSIDGEDYDHLSALQSLALESFYGTSKTVLTMKGGNDQLPKAFARTLSNQIRYGAAVIAVSQSDDKVRVSVQSGGTRQQIEGDYLVLAIPFSVLRHVDMDSSFTTAKRDAIDNLRYESVVRVYLQFRNRFWAERGEDGTACTDSALGLVVDHTSSQPGTRGILEAQMEGDKGRRASAMSPEQRIRWVAEGMDKVHPGALANLEGGTSFCWDEQNPFARGAWAIYKAGEMSRFLPHVATPEGRVHFAGEHTSALAMTLEGAVESGRRVAVEIQSSSA